ncbi:hypothetical protein AAVH_13841 [Aphelenchoides avenae]|nr:hypothetical protein AAVH_13841 [Aphelenchus avenae]
MGVKDAMEAYHDWFSRLHLFGEAKYKYTRYVELRNWLKRQALTDAERSLVKTADQRAGMLDLPLMTAVISPAAVWIWNRKVRKVRNPLLLMIASRPIALIGAYTFSAFCATRYVRARTADKLFTSDAGIVQLAEKYQRDASGKGAKSDEALDGFVYLVDGTREGVTSGTTDF